MTLRHVKNWIVSFFKPVRLRSNVLCAGQNDSGTVVADTVDHRYDGLVHYQPYAGHYLLVGIEPCKKNRANVVYRFFDPATQSEFLLTKPLVKLLFNRVHSENEPGFAHRNHNEKHEHC